MNGIGKRIIKMKLAPWIITMLNHEQEKVMAHNFKKGDAVYYYNSKGDTIPAVVIKTTEQRVRIRAGKRYLSVCYSNIELQSGNP
jgi:hypothetical protein